MKKYPIQRIISSMAFIMLISASCNPDLPKVPDLLLGQAGLNQNVAVEKLASGITHFQVERGKVSNEDFYTLSTGAISQSASDSLVIRLKNLGLSSRIEKAAETNPHGLSLGVIIRTGKYDTHEDAKQMAKKLHQQGVDMAIRHTSEDGNPTTGPFQISLLEIDLNQFNGNIKAVLGKGKIQEKELTSVISNKNNAIAAINAGFFAWNTTVGVTGDPAGLSIIDGKLLSEATNGRAALIIDNNTLKKISIAHNVKTNINIKLKDTSLVINGINRSLGKILNCGNLSNSGIEIPVHDFVCKNEHEIVVFTPEFGERGEAGKGIEIAVNMANRVISISNERGGKIPEDGFLVQATGNCVEQLRKSIALGGQIELVKQVNSDEGPIPLKKGVFAINGGPTLLRGGEMQLSDRYKEGWETQFDRFQISDEFVDKKDKAAIADRKSNNRHGFYHGWVVRRHPRTAIGLTTDNKAYIAVVYGRQPGISAGASITEMSNLLKSFGAVEAFNLDGGGSSMMVVQGKKTGTSSDKEGERAIGDALIFTKN
ncbi:phosphodiester glycosidase family protein [Flagellimonas sp.]|uniref:phosphodiester glycosidase family protein n=1 Tax=Flagellimonas sp. TaxID=2058762 RepID=UPI003B5C0A4A